MKLNRPNPVRLRFVAAAAVKGLGAAPESSE